MNESKRALKTYAVYHDDELLLVGTAEECGKYLGVRPETIRWYCWLCNSGRPLKHTFVMVVE